MSDLIHSRRSFLRGIGVSLIAAPAIVRVSSLMPVRGVKLLSPEEIIDRAVDMLWDDSEMEFAFPSSLPAASWRAFNMGVTYRKYTEINNFPTDCLFTGAEPGNA